MLNLKSTFISLFYKKYVLITFFIVSVFFSNTILHTLSKQYLTHCTTFLFFDLIGVVLFILTLLTVILCLYFANNKLFKQTNLIYYVFLFITVVLLLFFTTNNFILFFIFYELLLIPSIYLALVSSPNIRSKHISFYFLFWTQLGSFLVFISICLLFFLIDTKYFSSLTNSNSYIIAILLFLGFGIKIPIWPFHFWLTKTHVEVNTSFSIFLSGILVKTALYGLYKFNTIFFDIYYIFFLIYFIGIIDVTLKLFSQIDIKKIVANCTIFEMNIIVISFLYLNSSSYLFLLYFSCLHTALSFLFFFTVECVYKRYGTRSIYGITNLINHYPILSYCVILNVLLFNGLPLTLKFNLEIILIFKLINYNFLYFFLFVFIQIIFIIFFTKNFFSLIFLNNNVKLSVDLQTYELLIYMSVYLLFIIVSLY